MLIKYCSGLPDDLAACDCKAGKPYRKRWVLRAYAAKNGLTPEHVGRLEEFDEGDLVRTCP